MSALGAMPPRAIAALQARATVLRTTVMTGPDDRAQLADAIDTCVGYVYQLERQVQLALAAVDDLKAQADRQALANAALRAQLADIHAAYGGTLPTPDRVS